MSKKVSLRNSAKRIPKKIIGILRYIYEAYLSLPYKYLLLGINNIEYDQMPMLAGFPIVNNSGIIKLGKNVIITSKARNNLVGGQHHTKIGAGKKGQLIIGNNVGISNAVIFCLEKIIIEDDVLIGGGAQIYDADFHSLKYKHRMERPDVHIKSAPVIIRKGAFIGTEALIMKGVVIGERSVVAARAVVVKSIPPDEIWGGNPAKFIRKIDNE